MQKKNLLSRWINSSVVEEAGRHTSNSLISVIQAGNVNLIPDGSEQGCLFLCCVPFPLASRCHWEVQIHGESFKEIGMFPWKASLFLTNHQSLFTKKYVLTKTLNRTLRASFFHLCQTYRVFPAYWKASVLLCMQEWSGFRNFCTLCITLYAIYKH